MTLTGGFGDELAAALPELRAMAESRMLDTSRIFYESGRTALDPVTRRQTPIYNDRIPSTPSRTPPATNSGADTKAGPAPAGRLTRRWDLPVAAGEVQAGDLVELLTAHPTTDQSLLGKRFRVIDPGYASQTTARRMQVVEET